MSERLSPEADRRRRALDWLDRRLPVLARQAAPRLTPVDADVFIARVEHGLLDLYRAVDEVYGSAHDTDVLVERFLSCVLHAAAERPRHLRALDHRREIDPGWFQRARMVGYVCYVDRFAGTLAGAARRLDYLADLGVTYLHLMPLLRSRPGENDGGYAVMDYRAVDPALGTVADLEALARGLHARGMSLCVDLVLNHTAREHEWAQKAMAGSATHRAYYHVFADRTEPDRYEQTLREVFPDFAPGNFTWVDELDAWVWTTFHEFQWDLDYANPDVFASMLETMLFLANRGVDVLRLDAVPFLWKRMGTDCENQPETHALLQALRALMRIGAPAVAFTAEAIVPPNQLVQYLGAHDVYRPECDIAYNNQLMVMLWSSLAARDTRLMTHALGRIRPAPPSTAWLNYVRCHDDIGWAVSDDDAAAVGWNAHSHRAFLNDYYAGEYPGSPALGARFQHNPATGDARTSGTAAALCGIEKARADGDAEALKRATRRLVLLYSVAYSYGGIPLIYMGDELALPNDTTHRDDPARRDDNRWMHRPWMDWEAAERRHDATTVEARVFGALRALGEARRQLLALRAGAEVTPLWTDDAHVFAYRRRHPRTGPFLGLANFDDEPRSCDAGVLAAAGLSQYDVAATGGAGFAVRDGRIHLPPWGFAWLVG